MLFISAILVYFSISIHAPVKGATAATMAIALRTARFQSTHP